MKKIVLLQIIVVIIIVGCQQNNSYKTDCQTTEKELELLELVKINPAAIRDLDSFLISDFVRTENGSIYLLDGYQVKIARFSINGDYHGVFLKKGEGPGEFNEHPKMQWSNNKIWVFNERKIAKFSAEGELEDEIRFNRHYRNLTPVNENTFIAWQDDVLETSNKWVKSLALFSMRPEERLLVFAIGNEMGRFFIEFAGSMISVIPNPGIIPNLLYDYDAGNNIIYYASTGGYQVIARDLSGRELWKTNQKFTRALISDNDKLNIAKDLGAPDENTIKQIKKALPERFTAIKKIKALPSGQIIVTLVRGYGKHEWHKLDKKGKLLDRFKLTDQHKFNKIEFIDDRIMAVIVETEAGALYQEYHWSLDK